MSRPGAVRQYGKQSRRPRAERLFAELPQSPMRRTPRKKLTGDDDVGRLSELVAAVKIGDESEDGECGARKKGLPRSARGAEATESEESEEQLCEEVVQPESPVQAADRRKPRTKSTKGAEPSEKGTTPRDEETVKREPETFTNAAGKKPRAKVTKGTGTKEKPKASQDLQETAAREPEPEAKEAAGRGKLRTKSTKAAETKKKA
ncbi:hypothetical protein IMZ48_29650, partial [Candidatus Bathyarchaeota archaeon]|nr:hypothetical protein [Candidatus Bathyarchaeota archaeon]